jgi:integrase
VLLPEDEDKFFAAFDAAQGAMARDICRLVLHTGLRQNDVLGLRKFNIDLTARVLRIVQGKTKRRLEIPLTDTAYDILSARMKMPGVLLFPSPKTGNVTRSVRKAITNACRRAGIPRLSIRDLRRTCATRLDDYGFPTATIAKYLGHSDLRSVLRYTRSTSALKDAANALENKGNDARQIKPASLKIVK